MLFGICLLSHVAGRKAPAASSEMVTQLLFGEHYSVIENGDGWIKVKTAVDDYECWISAKQHNKISDTYFKYLQNHKPILCGELVQVVHNKLSDVSFPITLGATLPFFKQHAMSFEAFVFGYDGKSLEIKHKNGAKEILDSAFLYLNAPYLWGGRSPFGIDCSGFTQMVYRLNGYTLPRDAYQQVELGEALSFVEESEAGDLAFFDNEEGHIVHVGILLTNKQIIHASGQVRIDKFDHYGIYNSETKKYSHTLRVIKRIIN